MEIRERVISELLRILKSGYNIVYFSANTLTQQLEHKANYDRMFEIHSHCKLPITCMPVFDAKSTHTASNPLIELNGDTYTITYGNEGKSSDVGDKANLLVAIEAFYTSRGKTLVSSESWILEDGHTGWEENAKNKGYRTRHVTGQQTFLGALKKI
jgi:hypothetical protein